jgi:hypothetical protein
MRLLSAISLLLALSGCANYEYQLVQPDEFAQHIGAKNLATIQRPPLEYQFETVDQHLVMLIHNHTTDPIDLIGYQSTVVDPNGESHPVRSARIAPDSFVRFVFPPYQREIEHYEPGGFYTWAGGPYRHRHITYYDPGYYYTTFLYTNYDWDWPAQLPAKFTFTFRQKDQTFTQDFVFQKQKV